MYPRYLGIFDLTLRLLDLLIASVKVLGAAVRHERGSPAGNVKSARVWFFLNSIKMLPKPLKEFLGV